MSRVSEKFCELARLREGCLACYLMGGDPDLEFSRQAILTAAEAGADIVEVGIPFSEPIGDGPTIQAAGARALAAGVTPKAILGMVSQVKHNCDVPVVIMTYYNIALRPGLREFAQKVASSGADGVILADLPVPEAGAWIKEAQQARLDTIFLASPTSTDQALQEIGATATGFVYCVSLMGVTGARESFATGVGSIVGRIKANASLPVLIGFGISTPGHVREACEVADGVVVGSALIDLAVRHYDNRSAALEQMSQFVAEMKTATRSRRPASAAASDRSLAGSSTVGEDPPSRKGSAAAKGAKRGGR